jgi:sugar phosphate permease
LSVCHGVKEYNFGQVIPVKVPIVGVTLWSPIYIALPEGYAEEHSEALFSQYEISAQIPSRGNMWLFWLTSDFRFVAAQRATAVFAAKAKSSPKQIC